MRTLLDVNLVWQNLGTNLILTFDLVIYFILNPQPFLYEWNM